MYCGWKVSKVIFIRTSRFVFTVSPRTGKNTVRKQWVTGGEKSNLSVRVDQGQMISSHKASCTHHTYTGLPPENKGQLFFLIINLTQLQLSWAWGWASTHNAQSSGVGKFKWAVWLKDHLCPLVFLGSHFRSLEAQQCGSWLRACYSQWETVTPSGD